MSPIMFKGLPKPEYEGQEMMWEYSPPRYHEYGRLLRTDRIVHYRLTFHLTAKYDKGCVGLVWVDQNNNIARG